MDRLKRTAGPWALGVVMIATVSCGDLHGAPDASDAPSPRDAAVSTGGFAIGVEYSELGLADVYRQLGATWTKPRVEIAEWGAIEPDAPVGGVHIYRFECLDSLVREYQGAGMDLQVYLTPKSAWGSVSARDIMPTTAHLPSYRTWARALIERYDGDGIQDAPNLLRPIRHWVVGAEWTGFWPSSNAPGYLAVAEATREEARAASPEVLLGMIPFMLIDVFAGDPPTAAEIATRLAESKAFRNSTSGMMEILGRGDLFDFVDVHSLGDYTEIPPMLDWLRAQMAARGYSRPVWIDDAFPISFLANSTWPTMHPVTATNRSAILGLLRDVAKLEEPAYSTAMEWVRAETAKGTIHKIVTALGEGAAGINIGNTEDWMHDTAASFRDASVALIGAAAAMGMTDVSHPSGYRMCQSRTPGALRPAARSLALVIAKLSGGAFDTIERVVLADSGVRGYRLIRGGHTLLIVWYEDRVLQLPGSEEPAVAVTLALPGVTTATVTTAVTALDQTEPSVVNLPVVSGMLALSLTSIPVFVEPSP